MANLSDLVGKVCTVSTVEVNFRFKAEQMMDYFMGFVESIDEEFVWLRHTQTKCISAIARKYIVSIAEEQILYDANPEHAKIIEEYRKEKPDSIKNAFVNPKALSDLTEKMKNTYG